VYALLELIQPNQQLITTMTIESFIQNIEDNVEAVEAGTLKPDTNPNNLEAWDSLAVLSVLAMIDSEYDVQVSGTELSEMTSIQQMFDAVQAKRGSASPA
tara:strand:- start:1396 stop:1695 length:300 start_codon:yes stop_codon:yes gene_type:complete